jgi:hypothetical protein
LSVQYPAAIIVKAAHFNKKRVYISGGEIVKTVYGNTVITDIVDAGI